MLLSVDEMMPLLDFLRPVRSKLATLHELGLGVSDTWRADSCVIRRRSATAEAGQRMGRGQSGSVFVFDEPTIGLHPLDVLVLLRVFDSLVASGATVVVIEHDLDVIANADYLIDMGPGGGMAGGRIVCEGTPETVRACPDSVTGRYLRG